MSDSSPREVARKLKYSWTLPDRIGSWHLVHFREERARYATAVRFGGEVVPTTVQIELGKYFSSEVWVEHLTEFAINIFIGEERKATDARIGSFQEKRVAATALMSLLRALSDRLILKTALEGVRWRSRKHQDFLYESVDEFASSFNLNLRDERRSNITQSSLTFKTW